MQRLMDRDRKIIRNMIDIEICKKSKEHDLQVMSCHKNKSPIAGQG